MDMVQLREGEWPRKENISIERLSASFFAVKVGDTIWFKQGDRIREFQVTGKVRSPFVPPPQFGGQAFFFMSSAAMERFGGEVVPASGWVEGARCVKDAEEIELIAQAQALADAAFADILGSIRAGRTEREVALELEYAMRRAGSDGVAFPLIVASGPNSALPHAGVTDRVIERGDFVKLDFGARVGGYRSDMTRTVVVGAASPRHRQIYEGVRLANEAGIDAVAAGRTGIEVDAEARAVLDRLGIEGAFRHGLGHGVGLDVHEGPSLSPKGERALESGMVVTVEPGVYVPGFGGVRIEDLVVVEAGGCRVLSTAPKELIEL
jgi:Xaa-Pro aminopeptidase